MTGPPSDSGRAASGSCAETWQTIAHRPTQLQRTQIDADQQLLRDEDLLNEEHLRRMDQVLLRRNLDHARMFSRKLSLELQQFVHLYTPRRTSSGAGSRSTWSWSA